MEYYDLTVVGGGPAGFAAARKAAEANVKVLLLEKERSLGVKACAEAVSKATLTDAEISPSPKFICNHIKGAVVYAPDERRKVEILSKEFSLGEGYMLDKASFLNYMASLATRAGADIWVNSEFIDTEEDADGSYTIQIKKFGVSVTIKSRFIAGCEGVNSPVAKKFFKRPNYEFISCIQYKMVNCELENWDMLEFYVGSEVAPLGYVWIFPKYDGLANVGIGLSGNPAKNYLDKFISKHPEKFKYAKIVEVKGAPVPISGQIEQIVNGGMMLCGDSAAQVIPLTGGGIHSSIVAGIRAGEVVGKVVCGKAADLNEYPLRYLPWTERISKSLSALKIMKKLNDSDLNMLAEVLTGEDIVDLADGLNFSRVSRKLLKHPYFALRLAKARIG